MNNESNYKSNPLNGVSLKNMLTELVSHYGFDILFAYLNINCFKTNPSIISSVKFLKKTQWAREKVELFYLYKLKNLPRVSSEQFETPPRDRIIPEGQSPGKPAILSMEDAVQIREQAAAKAAEYSQSSRQRSTSGKSYGSQQNSRRYKRESEHTNKDESKLSNSSRASVLGDADPWAKWRK